MDILELTNQAMERRELMSLLRGDAEYMVEWSQYAPGAKVIDVGKVLSKGIYKVYKEDTRIKDEYEQNLVIMLDMSDFDVYLLCLYVVSQLYKEKNELSPFIMEKQEIIKKINKELIKRETNIMNGIVYPSRFKNKKAWDELLFFDVLCKEEYDIALF